MPAPRRVRKWPKRLAITAITLAAIGATVWFLGKPQYRFVRQFSGELRSAGRFKRFWGPVANDDCYAFRGNGKDILASLRSELLGSGWKELFNMNGVAIYKKGAGEAQFEGDFSGAAPLNDGDPTCVVWVPHVEGNWLSQLIDRGERQFGLVPRPKELNAMVLRRPAVGWVFEDSSGSIGVALRFANPSDSNAHMTVSEIFLKDFEPEGPSEISVTIPPWSTVIRHLRFPAATFTQSDFASTAPDKYRLLSFESSDGPGSKSISGTPRYPRARIRPAGVGAELLLESRNQKQFDVRRLQIDTETSSILKSDTERSSGAGASIVVPISEKRPHPYAIITLRGEFSLDHGVHWHRFDLDFDPGKWPSLKSY